MQYSPPSTIHLDGSAGIESYPGTCTNLRNEGASFTDMGGIETFALHDPISNRSERRMQNTYLTGRRQFEGEVRVSPPTDDESIMQVFGGNSGATTQMIRAYNDGGGTLRKVPGSVLLAENVHGTWVKVNVIHDVGAQLRAARTSTASCWPPATARPPTPAPTAGTTSTAATAPCAPDRPRSSGGT